jgi:hypothetical protein
MNIQAVGVENLPNIYIEKIVVDDLDSSYQIRIVVKMYDDKIRPSWRNRISGLQAMVFMTSNQDDMVKLKEGEKSLFDFRNLNLNTTRKVACDSFRMAPFSVQYDEFFQEVSFSIAKSPSLNLSVYAACFIDDLGFDVDLFDKFFGPMTAEKIFVGGQINLESGYFYYPETNEEHAGPVHVRAGRYMNGSEHEVSSSDVRFVFEENFKIIYYDSNVKGGGNSGNPTGSSLDIEKPEDRTGILDREQELPL